MGHVLMTCVRSGMTRLMKLSNLMLAELMCCVSAKGICTIMQAKLWYRRLVFANKVSAGAQ